MVRARYSARCSMGSGLIGPCTNDNGRHREPKFDNESEHRHFHIDTFRTFLAWLHEQEKILNRLLWHVG